jgi:starvation-inducible DNA-binding protein
MPWRPPAEDEIMKTQATRLRSVEVLRTPSDLSEKNTRPIADALNRLVADSFALYIKTKNFHWHMSGPHFRDYHLLLDEQGEQIYASIDPLAERVRKLGQRTVRSIGEIAKLSRVKDNEAEFVDPLDMLGELIADNKSCAAAMRKAHELCDELEDSGTAGLLETLIDETERRTWFLFEASRQADATGH